MTCMRSSPGIRSDTAAFLGYITHQRKRKPPVSLERNFIGYGMTPPLVRWPGGARIAVQIDRTCRGRYEALRARGHSYGRALRGVADRLLGVACVLLQRQTLFDPDHGAPAGP